jgi:hypothetical protein
LTATLATTSKFNLDCKRGSFSWLVASYFTAPQFLELPAITQRSYRGALSRVCGFALKDGRTFGQLMLPDITPAVADQIHVRLKFRPDGEPRLRSAMLSMRIAQRAWSVTQRRHAAEVPPLNPFARMGIRYRPKPTRPVTYTELERFVVAADAVGDPSIGTAAMIAYFWLQRQADILGRLTWAHYRPAHAPDLVQIFHHKTHELIAIPLFDEDGTQLWPEMTARLEQTMRRGELIVMRDQLDRRRKTYLPWLEDYFRHRVADIRERAGISSQVKFMGLRHGGNTEGADADLSDAQLRALSGHKTANMTVIYAKVTMKQRQEGARKRRDARSGATKI